MNSILLIAALLVLTLTAMIVLLLRTFRTTCLSYADSRDPMAFSWKAYPFQRLLDPADFEYLRSSGITEAQVKKLRAERRKIFRLCLRSLARDFNTVHQALKTVLVHCQDDRPDLVAALSKQQLTFYRNLLTVQAWLILHACGFDNMPAIDLVAPLQMMQA